MRIGLFELKGSTSTQDSILFNLEGTVSVTEGGGTWCPPQNITLKSVYFTVETVGTDATTVQLVVDGSVVGTATAAAGESKSSVVSIANVPVTPTQFISLNVAAGTTAKNLTACAVYEYVTNLPLATTTSIGGVKFGNPDTTGVHLNASGEIAVSGGGGGGGSGTGFNVLTNTSYFSPDQNPANADYKYVSIGTGGDFVDIYAFADFINSARIESNMLVWAVFKTKGVINLDKGNVFFSHASNGNWAIQGCGATGIAADDAYGDAFTTAVTAITTGTPNDVMGWDQATNSQIPVAKAYDVFATVADATDLYVGGRLALYADTSGVLAYPKLLMGLWEILGINGTTVQLRVEIPNYAGQVIPTTATGLVIVAKSNRTTLSGASIKISGLCGNGHWEGGLYGITITEAVELITPSAYALLYQDVHARGITAYPGGTYETWGDVFISNSMSLSNCTYMGYSDHYVSNSTTSPININNSRVQLYLNTPFSPPKLNEYWRYNSSIVLERTHVGTQVNCVLPLAVNPSVSVTVIPNT